MKVTIHFRDGATFTSTDAQWLLYAADGKVVEVAEKNGTVRGFPLELIEAITKERT